MTHIDKKEELKQQRLKMLTSSMEILSQFTPQQSLFLQETAKLLANDYFKPVLKSITKDDRLTKLFVTPLYIGLAKWLPVIYLNALLNL